MRVGPIGPSPSSVRRRFFPAANALRSAPAQKTPWAPVRMATLAVSSSSKVRNASASASRVGSSTALRTSGRSIVTMRTGPSFSMRTVGLMQPPCRGVGVGSGLDDRHHEADGREDVADAHAFRLGADLHDGLAAVVDLPADLPAFRLLALDRLLQLTHHLLERVAVAIVKDGHPGRGDRSFGDLVTLGDLVDVGPRSGLLPHTRVL